MHGMSNQKINVALRTIIEPIPQELGKKQILTIKDHVVPRVSIKL